MADAHGVSERRNARRDGRVKSRLWISLAMVGLLALVVAAIATRPPPARSADLDEPGSRATRRRTAPRGHRVHARDPPRPTETTRGRRPGRGEERDDGRSIRTRDTARAKVTRGPSPSPPCTSPADFSHPDRCLATATATLVFRDDPARRVACRVFAGLSTVEYPSPYGLRRDAVHEPIPSRRGHAHE